VNLLKKNKNKLNPISSVIPSIPKLDSFIVNFILLLLIIIIIIIIIIIAW
jgi:hypothetical protein